MQVLHRCDNCSSDSFTIFGCIVEADALHLIQCQCSMCGLVFANPQAARSELHTYYQSYYSQHPGLNVDDVNRSRAYNRHRIKQLMRYKAGGNLLEIGCGSGVFLDEARRAGFGVSGLDLSEQAIRFCRETYGFEHLYNSTLEETPFSDTQFDVVYAWHVIEHVPSVDGFLKEIWRILKPGGVLMIGTENCADFGVTVPRIFRLLTGRIPRIATSSEHTFIFSDRTLTDALARRGYKVVEMVRYDEVTPEFRVAGMRFSDPIKRELHLTVWRAFAFMNRIIGNGPYISCVAIRE